MIRWIQYPLLPASVRINRLRVRLIGFMTIQ